MCCILLVPWFSLHLYHTQALFNKVSHFHSPDSSTDLQWGKALRCAQIRWVNTKLQNEKWRKALNIVKERNEYVHLASTWRHSHDECSQAFPIFRWFTAPVYCECKWKVKRGRSGNEANPFYYSPLNCYIIPDGAHHFKTPPENALISCIQKRKTKDSNIDSVAPFYHSFILLTKGIWICAAQSDTYLRKHHRNMAQKIRSQSMDGGKSRQKTLQITKRVPNSINHQKKGHQQHPAFTQECRKLDTWFQHPSRSCHVLIPFPSCC